MAAIVTACCAVPVIPAAGQDRYRVITAENFRQEPGPTGRLLARVNEGAELVSGATEGRWLEVTLAGWIWEGSVGAAPGGEYDLVVRKSGGENLRAEPNGTVLARLLTGFLLTEVERRDGWVRVQRTGWMWSPSLRAVQAPAAPAPPAGQSSPAAARLDRAATAARAGLHASPDGDSVGVLGARTGVRVLGRSGDWVRVQVEGWVREADLGPAADGVLAGVTGSEVRSRPEEFAGRLLQWRVQYISLQQADELRRDMPANQRYMLARGPVPDRGFIYVLLTAEQLRAVEAMAPLTELTIIGRVRSARSQYLGNPILELVDFAVDQP